MASVFKVLIGFVIGVTASIAIFVWSFRWEILAGETVDSNIMDYKGAEMAASLIDEHKYSEAVLEFEKIAQVRTDYVEALSVDQFNAYGQLVLLYEHLGEEEKMWSSIDRALEISYQAYQKPFRDREELIKYLKEKNKWIRIPQ